MTVPGKPELSEQTAGSPGSGEPVFLVVGKLRRPHGVRGELVMEVITGFPERLRSGVTVYVGDHHKVERIRSCRSNGATLLVAFDSYRDPETSGTLRNQYVYVRADDRPPLPEGEYYHHQLLGLQVVSDEGRVLGKLVEILDTGANDVYIVRPERGTDILLPAIGSIIKAVDLVDKRITVHLLPGLVED